MENKNVIVSLTSHTAERLKNVGFYLYHSILKYNYNFVKIVLTLYKDDIKNIPADLKEMIDSGTIELIIADIDLKCNLKYFYAMKKYRNLPIITIDDDSIYPKEMILDFLENSKKYPNTVICRSAKIINVNKSYHGPETFNCNVGVEKNIKWKGHYNEVRNDLNPEGYGGIFYPANILEIDDEMIPEIKESFLRADDIFLTILEKRKKIKTVLPYYSYNKLDKCTRPAFSLCEMRDNNDMINLLIQKYKKELI